MKTTSNFLYNSGKVLNFWIFIFPAVKWSCTGKRLNILMQYNKNHKSATWWQKASRSEFQLFFVQQVLYSDCRNSWPEDTCSSWATNPCKFTVNQIHFRLFVFIPCLPFFFSKKKPTSEHLPHSHIFQVCWPVWSPHDAMVFELCALDDTIIAKWTRAHLAVIDSKNPPLT